MLKLIIHDRNSAKTLWSNTLALLCILDCNLEASSSATKSHSGDAYSARKKSLSDGEEARSWLFNLGLEHAVFIHIAVLAEDVDTGNANISETNDSVVNTIDSNLDAHVTDLHTRLQVHVAISDRNKESVDTFVLSINDSLSENDRHVGVVVSV